MSITDVPGPALFLAGVIIVVALQALAAFGWAFHQYVNDGANAAAGALCFSAAAWFIVGSLTLTATPVIGLAFILFAILTAGWAAPILLALTAPPQELLDALAHPTGDGWTSIADARRAANLGGGFRNPSDFTERRRPQ